MEVLFWFAFIILTVPLLFTMGVWGYEGSRDSRIVWGIGVLLWSILVGAGFYHSITPNYYQGEVKIVEKEYRESYQERRVKGGYRTIPECYSLVYLPTIQTKTEPEHHIGGACIPNDQWDKVKEGQTVNIKRDSFYKPWGWTLYNS